MAFESVNLMNQARSDSFHLVIEYGTTDELIE